MTLKLFLAYYFNSSELLIRNSSVTYLSFTAVYHSFSLSICASMSPSVGMKWNGAFIDFLSPTGGPPAAADVERQRGKSAVLVAWMFSNQWLPSANRQYRPYRLHGQCWDTHRKSVTVTDCHSIWWFSEQEGPFLDQKTVTVAGLSLTVVIVTDRACNGFARNKCYLSSQTVYCTLSLFLDFKIYIVAFVLFTDQYSFIRENL